MSPFMTQLGLYLGGFITLAAFSYLYKENPFYRWAEYTYIGLITANGLVATWFTYLQPTITVDIVKNGQYSLIIPGVIGLLIYARYYKPIAWLSRIPVSMWVGYGMGFVLAAGMAPFMTQVTRTFTKFASLNDMIFFICAVSVMIYFLFTIRVDQGILQYPSRFGKFVLLIAFGAFFAYNVMSYGSLILGRIQYLFGDVLKILKV